MADDKKELRDLVVELRNAVEQKHGVLEVKNQEAYNKINERLDAIEFDSKKNAHQSSDANLDNGVKTEFKEVLRDFTFGGDRKGINSRELKSAYKGGKKSNTLVRFDIAAAGALLMPAQVSEEIIKNVVEATPILQLARVTPTDRSDYKRRARTSTPGVTWLAEASTNSIVAPQYAEISIPPQKAASRFAMSQEQIDDTGYDLVSEMTECFREDFAAGFGTATLSGNGVGKPYGMIGRVSNYDSASVALSTDMLIRMQEQLKENYQASSSWLMTRLTRAYIRSLVLSSTNGLQYTWEPDFKRQSPTLLLGAPVYIAKEGDLAGRVSGNFTAGQVPLIYGDFSQGYEVTRHTEMYLIDDIYTGAAEFVRNLHIMARFGGNVIKSEALVQLSITAS
jgi:HK97 family phage major capsid protein